MFRLSLLVIFLLVAIFVSDVFDEAEAKKYWPVLYTKLGPVKGSFSRSQWSHKRIYQFQGIPFAKPPIGELRFKPPVAVEKWTDVLDASQFGRTCPVSLGAQVNPNESYKNYTDTGVEEDCLFLNVYTPTLSEYSNLPVMYYIHGGGFSMRSSREFRPELLLEKDVILVVPQYRLGPLGFLSADILDAPGNAGLLDILLALRWVRDNIESFGGDPNQVTVIGQSAGAGISSVLLFSPLVEPDLFQRVIFQSGSALGPWMLDEKPVEAARGVAEFADCSAESIQEEIDCLKQLSYVDVLKAHSGMLLRASMTGGSGFSGASPVIQHVGDQRFLPEHPSELFRQGRYLRKPTLAGVVAHEASYIVGDIYYLLDGQTEDYLKHNLTRLILKFVDFKDQTGFMEYLLKEKYFKENELGNLTLMVNGLIDLASSLYLKSCTFTLAQEMSRSYPTYLYSLNYAGRYSKIGYGKPVNYPFPGGIAHSDDLLYLFPHEAMIMNNEESAISRQMVDFWTSFVTTGVPVSDEATVEWDPITTEKGPYLRIDKELSMRENFFKEYLVTVDEGLPPGPIIQIE